MTGRQRYPLVSAIITTLNRPQLVMRAIQSVRDQSYTNLELIVVVDGPDAATVAQLSMLSEPRLRIVALPENVGLGEARNVGVRHSQGEWIAFLDDDDEWYPEKIMMQLGAVPDDRYEVNFVASRFEERSMHDVRIRPKAFPAPGEHWSESFYCSAVLLLPSTFLVRRSLMVNFPFKRGMRRHEDADWLLRGQAAGVIRPRWVETALTVYHCEGTEHRLSTQAEWRGRYQWYLENPTLLTSKAVPYYIGMICIPEAKRSPSPIRSCSFLLKEAIAHGRLTPHSLAYLAMATATSRNLRGKLRKYRPLLNKGKSWHGKGPLSNAPSSTLSCVAPARLQVNEESDAHDP